MDELVARLEEQESPAMSTRARRNKKAEESDSSDESVDLDALYGKKKKGNKRKSDGIPKKQRKGPSVEATSVRPMPSLQESPMAEAQLMQQPILASPQTQTEENPASGSPQPDNPFEMATTPVFASQEATAAAAAAITGTIPPDASPTDSTHSKRASPVTTARQKKKNQQKQIQIKKGVRVKIRRKNLYHILTTNSQKEKTKGFNDNYNFYGRILSGSAQQGYNVEFSAFPVGEKTVFVKRRWLTAVAEDATDEYDRVTDDPKVLDEIDEQEKKKKKTVYQLAIEKFVALEPEIQSVAKTFDMVYNEKGDAIHWDILLDNEHIYVEDDPMKYPVELSPKKTVDFGEEGSYDEYGKIFFDEFFPDVTGHGKKLDKYFANINAPMYQTVANDKIKFNDETDRDPDWIVKQGYLLILAAATESDTGVENLWKRGKSGGRHDHADFGQYMPQNYFKAFISGAAMMFCEEAHWYLPKRDRPWDIFMPALDGFNMKRRSLFHVVLSILDESMSGWRPKTSKLGGLPHLTFEPRKPVPLGTMLRNCVECITGCFAYQDVVMNPEIQQMKQYYYSNSHQQVRELSSLPDRSPITAHTAEVLRLCKGAALEPGGWTGGDAWFGSVMSAVELKKRLDVFSTFVVKNHRPFFPMEVLFAILKARHGSHPAGHWVVMKASISGVPILAIAYAWSQKGVSYFVSTCGSTEPSDIKYESKFEDAWGNTGFKLIDRPQLCHFLFEYLPLIDEHNKQRQSILALEKRWLTKDPWLRLVTTLVGMSCVDMHRLFRHQSIKVRGMDIESIDMIRVLGFSDKICGSLRPWPRKAQRLPVNPEARRAGGSLSRITSADGTTTTYKLTDAQMRKGKKVGNSITLVCYVCRGFKAADGKSVYKPTSFWCSLCHMPLCQQDRRKEVDLFGAERDWTCIQLHLQSNDHFGCIGPHIRGSEFPDEHKRDLHPRRGIRRR